MNKHELQLAIEQANANGRKAVIPFITAGFPNPVEFWDTLAQIDATGVDIIEIGVPFSDPVADGPVIENASREAIEKGVTLDWIIKGLTERSGQYKAKLVFMGYANPFFQYGLEKLANDASKAGVSGFIIPDLQLDEMELFRKELEPCGLALIAIVSSNTPLERMKEYARVSSGFVYITAVLGITGGTSDISNLVAETVERARQAFDIPLALGFGLHHPSQFDTLPGNGQPDAAIIGSALIKHIEKGGTPADFFDPWLS